MVWVFGYGSLMWRPGFAYEARSPAVLAGYHRAFCRYSLRHRGTPQRPGLVIGLSEGGRCTGAAYRIASAAEPDVLAYLDEREGAGYHRLRLPVTLLADPTGDGTAAAGEDVPGSVQAWTYVPNPEHPSYFGRTDRDHIVRLVAQGVGESGTAYDYLRDMLTQIERLGVEEPELWAVLHAVEALRGGQSPAAGDAPGNVRGPAGD